MVNINMYSFFIFISIFFFNLHEANLVNRLYLLRIILSIENYVLRKPSKVNSRKPEKHEDHDNIIIDDLFLLAFIHLSVEDVHYE